MRCPTCEQVYRVAQSHVTRTTVAESGSVTGEESGPAKADANEGPTDPLLGEGESPATGSADAPSPAGQSAFGSPSREESYDEPVQGEPVTTDAEPRRLRGGFGTERLRRITRYQHDPNKGYRALLLLAGGLGGILAAMALMLWLASNDPTDNTPANESPNHSETESSPESESSGLTRQSLMFTFESSLSPPPPAWRG